MFSVLLSLSVISISYAQLNGTYTIDSSKVREGTNFQSFTEFADTLNTAGVSGPVTANVVAHTSPYRESIVFNDIVGASPTSAVTINGNGVKIYSDSLAPIRLDGTDHIIIDSLVLENAGTADYTTYCFILGNDADSNVIRNSELIISRYKNTTTYGSGYISASSMNNVIGYPDYTFYTNGNFNTIENNLMWNGGSGDSIGPYVGLLFEGYIWCPLDCFYSTINNMLITKNKIKNTY
ncbi:MAG: hypothetical protein ACPGTP_09330, partial [Bacteroidia bacterium]